MSNEKMMGYMVGLLAGMLMAATVYWTAHIENGLLFFLATWPSVLAIFGGGYWFLTIADKEDE